MATFADNEIFKPLKMSSTLFHNNHNRIVKNKAYGYTPSLDLGSKLTCQH